MSHRRGPVICMLRKARLWKCYQCGAFCTVDRLHLNSTSSEPWSSQRSLSSKRWEVTEAQTCPLYYSFTIVTAQKEQVEKSAQKGHICVYFWASRNIFFPCSHFQTDGKDGANLCRNEFQKKSQSLKGQCGLLVGLGVMTLSWHSVSLAHLTGLLWGSKEEGGTM